MALILSREDLNDDLRYVKSLLIMNGMESPGLNRLLSMKTCPKT